MWQRALGGGAVGGIAGGLAASVAGGIAAPLHQGIALALASGGGSGAGVARVAGAMVSLLTSSVRMAATAGGAALGAAFGALFGIAIGGLTGSLAGAIGGVFAEAGRALGETLGGVVQLFQDSIRSSEAFADSVMGTALRTNQSAESAANLTTSLQALGMATPQIESSFGGISNQLWIMEARLGAFGIGVERTRSGAVDWAGSLSSVSERLLQLEPRMRPFYARGMLGAGADAILPELLNPQIMADMRRSQEEMAPSAANIARLWTSLKVPLNEIAILWQNIKLEFISAFVPYVRAGIGELTNLWATHGEAVKEFFTSLPTRALSALAQIADGLQRLYSRWAPLLSSLFDGMIAGARALGRVLGMVRDHPAAATLLGTAVGGPLGGAAAYTGSGMLQTLTGEGDGFSGTNLALYGSGAIGASALINRGGSAAAAVLAAQARGSAARVLGGAGIGGVTPLLRGLGVVGGLAGVGLSTHSAYQRAREGEGFSGLGLGGSVLSGAIGGLSVGGPIGALIGAIVGAGSYGIGAFAGNRRGIHDRGLAAAAGASLAEGGDGGSVGGGQWGDVFRRMGDVFQRVQDRAAQRPLKIEAEITLKQEIKPDPRFNVQLETNEILQSWRGVQLGIA